MNTEAMKTIINEVVETLATDKKIKKEDILKSYLEGNEKTVEIVNQIAMTAYLTILNS